MKRFSVLFCAMALLSGGSAVADGGHPRWFGPMPPDPLMAHRVTAPVSAASLTLRLIVDPGGLAAWEFMKETRSLSRAQLRSLVHEVLRAQRYYREMSILDVIALEAWADRDPAGAAADVVNIPDWEDRDGSIDDFDSDVEDLGWMLLARLAESDFPRAIRIADRLKGYETQRQFFSGLSARMLIRPSQLPVLVQLARRHRPYASPEGMAAGAVQVLWERKGIAMADDAVERMAPGPEKQAAARHIGTGPDSARVSPQPFVSDNPELARLAGLDCQEKVTDRVPFPLLRDVLNLNPGQALELGMKLGDDRKSLHWLGWMLFMRAADEDPRKAAAIQSEVYGTVYGTTRGFGRLEGIAFARRAAAPETAEELHGLPPGDAREEAMRGFLSRADLSKAAEWLDLAEKLDAPVSARVAMLVRLMMNGAAADAIRLAAKVKDADTLEGRPGMATRGLMTAWAIHDFRSALAFVALLPKDDYSQGLLEAFREAVKVLPAGPLLEVMSPEMLERMGEAGVFEDQFWVYLAHEDPEAAFGYFEQHAGDVRCLPAVSGFVVPAARRDPQRALVLAKKFNGVAPEGFTGVEDVVTKIASTRPECVSRVAMEVWDPELQRVMGKTLAAEHPALTVGVLKKFHHTAAWDGAGECFAARHSPLLKDCLPHMSREARVKILESKAEANLP